MKLAALDMPFTEQISSCPDAAFLDGSKNHRCPQAGCLCGPCKGVQHCARRPCLNTERMLRRNGCRIL